LILIFQVNKAEQTQMSKVLLSVYIMVYQ